MRSTVATNSEVLMLLADQVADTASVLADAEDRADLTEAVGHLRRVARRIDARREALAGRTYTLQPEGEPLMGHPTFPRPSDDDPLPTSLRRFLDGGGELARTGDVRDVQAALATPS